MWKVPSDDTNNHWCKRWWCPPNDVETIEGTTYRGGCANTERKKGLLWFVLKNRTKQVSVNMSKILSFHFRGGTSQLCFFPNQHFSLPLTGTHSFFRRKLLRASLPAWMGRAFVPVRRASVWEGAVSGRDGVALNSNEPFLSASHSINRPIKQTSSISRPHPRTGVVVHFLAGIKRSSASQFRHFPDDGGAATTTTPVRDRSADIAATRFRRRKFCL